MRARYLTLGVAALGLAACGGSDGGTTGGTGGTTCSTASTISITATGLTPPNVCVQPGGRVTFANNDATSVHDIEFDSAGCPTVGNVSSGGQVTATFPTAATCAYHDGRNPTSAAFRGTVAVNATVPPVGGY